MMTIGWRNCVPGTRGIHTFPLVLSWGLTPTQLGARTESAIAAQSRPMYWLVGPGGQQYTLKPSLPSLSITKAHPEETARHGAISGSGEPQSHMELAARIQS